MKKAIILLAVIVLLVSMASGATRPDIKKIKEKYEASLFAIEGISAVSADEIKGEIVIYIERPEISDKVPRVLEGFPVRHVVTGRIRAMGATEALTQSYPAAVYSTTGVLRPVFGGISLGSARIPYSAGTLGLVTPGNYILSNAHIIAMDNNANFVRKGTATWQPGGADGGDAGDAIGALYKYIPIRFYSNSANNYADAAISTLKAEGIKASVLNGTNNGFYTITGTTEVIPGDVVRKSGRTTGVTVSTVSSTTASVKVYYTRLKWALFKDQILVNQPFIQAGDSGSAVDKDGKFAGLVFAGSDTIAVVNKAKYITSGLGISI